MLKNRKARWDERYQKEVVHELETKDTREQEQQQINNENIQEPLQATNGQIQKNYYVSWRGLLPILQPATRW